MEKNAKTALCRFCAKFSKSGPAHIRKGRRSADRPRIGIEAFGYERLDDEKSAATASKSAKLQM